MVEQPKFPRMQRLATELEVSTECAESTSSPTITWEDILETYRRLSVQWDEPRASQFRCGEDVRQRLYDQYVVPYQDKPITVPAAGPGDRMFGIPVIVDESMAPDAWQVRDQSGTVMREGTLPKTMEPVKCCPGGDTFKPLPCGRDDDHESHCLGLKPGRHIHA